MRRLATFDDEVEAAARASSPDDVESLGALRFLVIQLVAGLGGIALVATAIAGQIDSVVERIVLVAIAVMCGVVLVGVRRARAVSSRFGLGFLSLLMAVAALVAATIQPAPLGTLTGFVFLGLAVCVAASEPAMVAVIFAALALALGLSAITTRSIVPVAAATIFVTITAVSVYVVIRFRMIVSNTRDRAISDALTDPLTGLGNRRRMDVAVITLGQVAERTGQRIGCLIIDIDHFKRVNDRFGHDVGDDVLRAVAATIADTVRAGDIVVRLGGDEFAVFALADSAEALMTMGERVRSAIELSQSASKVTASVGGSLSAASTTDEVKSLLALSDRALYGSKQAGRNVVNVA